MLIGYVRVSKSDGTQTLEPQRDAMLAAGVDPARIYEDLASGRRDDRLGLAACLKATQPGNTLVLWKPLAKLSDEDRAFIDALLARTLARPEILAAVRERFPQGRRGGVG